jgi:MFS family permease
MLSAAKKLLKNQDFLHLWASQTLSQITINTVNFVLITQIYEHSQSTLAVSMLWIFYSLPALLVGPFSGFIIDHFPRQKILLATNLLQSLAVFSYLFAQDKLPLIYLIAFIYSFLNQFYLPSESASIPDLVSKKSLPAANSLFFFTAQSSLALGFIFSAILIKFLGIQSSILFGTGMLILAALSVSKLPIKNQSSPLKLKNLASNLSQGFSQFIQATASGYKYLSHHRLISFGIGLIIFFQVITTSLTVVVPVIAQQILSLSIHDTGLIFVLPLVIGVVSGTFLFSRYSKKERKNKWIARGVGLLGLSIVLFAQLIPRLNGLKIPLSILLILLIGFSASSAIVPAQTFIQEYATAKFRGRVFGTLSFLITLASLPPLLLVATTVEIIGIRLFLTLIGILLSSLSLLGLRNANTIIKKHG